MMLTKEQQVTSLEMSKKLFDLLGNSETLFSYAQGTNELRLDCSSSFAVPAYTVSELLQIFINMSEENVISHVFRNYRDAKKGAKIYPDTLAYFIIKTIKSKIGGK